MIAAIVAVDRNWGIGCNNKLLTLIPEDMQYFKEMTTRRKHAEIPTMVVCGRKTYETIPKRPLEERKNVVLTRSASEEARVTDSEEEDYLTLEGFLEWLKSYDPEKFDIFIIGGGEIYKKLLLVCDKVFVTKIEKEFEADTFFPNVDKMEEFRLIEEGERKEGKGIFFQFLTYERRKEK